MCKDKSHQTPRKNTELLRLAVSGILTTVATITATAIHEIAFTNPSWVYSNRAIAQEDIGEQVYRKASPAVVDIKTPDGGGGSGFIITPDGKVVTNAHVVGDAATVTVTLHDKRQLQADVISVGEEDSNKDLALLQIRGQNNLSTIRWGGMDSIRNGQEVFAIGYPWHVGESLTRGIISRIDRDDRYIQTDAAINPGNSGGPLLNRQGELIGVNTWLIGPSWNAGINFAIVADAVQSFLREPPTGPKQVACNGQQQPQQLRLDASVVSGRLGGGSNILNLDKSFCTLYTFVGTKGQKVRIHMVSLEVDPYLILLDPNGVKLESDRGGTYPDAKIVIELPADGSYRVIAKSHRPGESGTYSLRGESLLLSETSKLQLGESADFHFRGQAGQSVTIILESWGINTEVSLIAPNAQVIGKDQEKLSVKLPADGLYLLAVTASDNQSDNEDEGLFTLVVRDNSRHLGGI